MAITLVESVGVLLAGELLLSKVLPKQAHITGPVTTSPPVNTYVPPPVPIYQVPRSNIVPTSMQVAPPDDVKLLDEVIAPDVPKPFRQCKGIIGQGYVSLSDDQILDIIKPAGSTSCQLFTDNFNVRLRTD